MVNGPSLRRARYDTVRRRMYLVYYEFKELDVIMLHFFHAFD